MVKRNRTIHRFPADEVEDFIKLLGQIKDFPKPGNALLELNSKRMLERERSEDVSKERGLMESHPLWRRLSRDREFTALMAAFRKNRRRSRHQDLPRTEFRFIYCVFKGAWFFANWKPVVPNADARKAAISLIDDLMRLRSKGIRLSDPQDSRTLSALLDRLADELKSVKRKAHEHLKFAESQAIHDVALVLELDLKGTSGTVLSRFAEFAGIELDESTIEKILKEERTLIANYRSNWRDSDIPRN